MATRAELLKFLDYVEQKGLMNANSAAARRAAVKAMLSIVDDDDDIGRTEEDIEDLANRVINIRREDFKPESLRVYKSRLSKTIREFESWRSNPAGYRPLAKNKAAAVKRVRKASKEKSAAPSTMPPGPPEPAEWSIVNEITVPVPLRPNRVVKIVGLPHDLTTAEATKLANVIKALAVSK